ncbi:MAG: DUF86 domain-containing protein [Deltaproteobacteria bacterium]|nr:DUF86 domain-containing protein [Deltaproteobacteria bacterium]
MYDRELAIEILTQIYEATQTILKRFEPIKSVEDFTGSDAGMEKLDSICMQLITIDEGLKNFDKVTNNSVLSKYPQVEWKKVKGLRDIISHHYFDVNAEAIFKVCKDHIADLGETIKKIIDEI